MSPPSRLPSFSLFALLVAVAAVAVVVGTLRSATPFLVGAAATACFVFFASAAITAAYRRGQGQAFAGGFLIAGVGYLALVNYLLADNETLRGNLLTGRLLVWSHELVVRETPDPAYRAGRMPGGMPGGPGGAGGGMGIGGAAGGAGAGGMAGAAGGGMGMPAAMGAGGGSPSGGFRAPTIQIPDYESFRDLGHYYWSLLLAVFGGWLARRFYSGREKQA